MLKRRDRIRIRFHRIWRFIKQLFTPDMPRTPYFQFSIETPFDEGRVLRALINIGFQWNYWSYFEKGQVINVRRCYVEDGIIRQEHVRIFEDGEVRAHDELAYEESAVGHLRGETVRNVKPSTQEELRRALLGGEDECRCSYYILSSCLKAEEEV